MEIALVGLAGVILGAVLSWVGTLWSERSKRQYEGRVLVRGEKLEAYGDFSSSTKEYVAVLYRLAAQRGIDMQTEILAPEEAEKLLAEIFRVRDRSFEKMRLVGSDDSLEFARAWVRAVYSMRNYLGLADVDVAQWSAFVARANEARDRFHLQARQELAVA